MHYSVVFIESELAFLIVITAENKLGLLYIYIYEYIRVRTIFSPPYQPFGPIGTWNAMLDFRDYTTQKYVS